MPFAAQQLDLALEAAGDAGGIGLAEDDEDGPASLPDVEVASGLADEAIERGGVQMRLELDEQPGLVIAEEEVGALPLADPALGSGIRAARISPTPGQV